MFGGVESTPIWKKEGGLVGWSVEDGYDASVGLPADRHAMM